MIEINDLKIVYIQETHIKFIKNLNQLNSNLNIFDNIYY